jgi:hypothetical protein
MAKNEVTYFSKILSRAENYCKTQQELLAIVTTHQNTSTNTSVAKTSTYAPTTPQ